LANRHDPAPSLTIAICAKIAPTVRACSLLQPVIAQPIPRHRLLVIDNARWTPTVTRSLPRRRRYVQAASLNARNAAVHNASGDLPSSTTTWW
jgi:hypothetical protein